MIDRFYVPLMYVRPLPEQRRWIEIGEGFRIEKFPAILKDQILEDERMTAGYRNVERMDTSLSLSCAAHEGAGIANHEYTNSLCHFVCVLIRILTRVEIDFPFWGARGDDELATGKTLLRLYKTDRHSYEYDLTHEQFGAAFRALRRGLKQLLPEFIDFVDRPNQGSRLLNAIDVVASGFQARHIAPRLIMNFTALESILSTSGTELSHQVSERLAWYLGKTKKERLELYERAKRLYVVRSQLVHGGKLSKKTEVLRALVETEKFVSDVFLKIFIRDHISVFRGADSDRADAFRRLVLDASSPLSR